MIMWCFATQWTSIGAKGEGQRRFAGPNAQNSHNQVYRAPVAAFADLEPVFRKNLQEIANAESV